MLDLPLSITYEGKNYHLYDYVSDEKAEYARFARLDESYSIILEIILTLRDNKFSLEIFDAAKKPSKLTKRNLSLTKVVGTNWTTNE